MSYLIQIKLFKSYFLNVASGHHNPLFMTLGTIAHFNKESLHKLVATFLVILSTVAQHEVWKESENVINPMLNFVQY